MAWYAAMCKELEAFKLPPDLPKDAHVELEGRLGTIDSLTGRFSAGLPPDAFAKLTKDLKLDYQPLRDLHYPSLACRRRNQEKHCTRKRYLRVATFKHEDSAFAFRIALAVEEHLTLPEKFQGVTILRERSRASLIKADGRFRYDFSQDSVLKEIEVESLKGQAFSGTDVHDLAYRMAHLIRGLSIDVNNTKWPVLGKSFRQFY